MIRIILTLSCLIAVLLAEVEQNDQLYANNGTFGNTNSSTNGETNDNRHGETDFATFTLSSCRCFESATHLQYQVCLMSGRVACISEMRGCAGTTKCYEQLENCLISSQIMGCPYIPGSYDLIKTERLTIENIVEKITKEQIGVCRYKLMLLLTSKSNSNPQEFQRLSCEADKNITKEIVLYQVYETLVNRYCDMSIDVDNYGNQTLIDLIDFLINVDGRKRGFYENVV